MIPSTTAFANALLADDRQFITRLTVNSTELPTIVNWTLGKGSCGGSEFSVGAVMSTVFTATLKDITTNLKGQEVQVEIGLMVNGAYEYITLANLTITEAKTTHYQTVITAYGHSVSKTDDVLSMSTTQTLSNIKNALSTATGVNVTMDASIDGSLVIEEPLTGMTIYQVLQTLASVVGGYAMDNADGSIAIHQFGTTSSITVGTDRMVELPDAEQENFTITGVEAIAGETTYTSGTPNITMENQFLTQDLFDDLATALVGYSYRPADITLSKGDPRLEGSDVLTVTDISSSYIVPCHTVTHTYDGGLSTQVSSIRATMQALGEATPAPISTRLKEQEKQIIEVTGIASNTNQYFWYNETGTDTGAHITEIPQDEFRARTAVDPTDGGGNLLARSNGIAVRDGLVELAQFTATSIRIGQTSQQNIVVKSEDNQTTSTHTGEILFRKGTGSIGSILGQVDPTTNRMILESTGSGSGGGSARVSLTSIVGNQSGIDPFAYVEVVDDYNTIDMTIKKDAFKVEQTGVDSFQFNVGMGINYTGSNNVLWQPTSQSASPYLTDTQTLTLSQPVSEQLTGIVLVWSRRASGTVYNDSWWYEYIPKWHAMNHGTQGIYMSTPTGFSATVCIKYVYIDDLEITGHASNSATGTGYANNTRVLRAVLGV